MRQFNKCRKHYYKILTLQSKGACAVFYTLFFITLAFLKEGLTPYSLVTVVAWQQIPPGK